MIARLSLFDNIVYVFYAHRFGSNNKSIPHDYIRRLNKKYGDYVYCKLMNTIIYTNIDDQDSLLPFLTESANTFKQGVSRNKTVDSVVGNIFGIETLPPITTEERELYKNQLTLRLSNRTKKEIVDLIENEISSLPQKMSLDEFKDWFGYNILDPICYKGGYDMINILTQINFTIYMIPSLVAKILGFSSMIVAPKLLRYLYIYVVNNYVYIINIFYRIDKFIAKTVASNDGIILKEYIKNNVDLSKTKKFSIAISNGLFGLYTWTLKYIETNDKLSSMDELYNFVSKREIQTSPPYLTLTINQNTYTAITGDQDQIPGFDGAYEFTITYLRTDRVFGEQSIVRCPGRHLSLFIGYEFISRLLNKYKITKNNNSIIFNPI